MMRRVLQPEWLDFLPPSHPAAVHNRRDLRLTNAAMRNHAWIRTTLARLVHANESAIELGAGTGELAQRLRHAEISVDGLDLWPRPPEWPADRRWHQRDLRHFDHWDEYSVVVGNLIFHQFSDDELAQLGRKLRNARVVIACEPVRSRFSQWAYAAIAPLFGANDVSLHDAHVSIAAGFRQRELADRLGLTTNDWEIRVTCTLLGAYRMVAKRLGSP